jgi:hypothetical protein
VIRTPSATSRLKGQKNVLSAGTSTGSAGNVSGPEGSLTLNRTEAFAGISRERS